MTDPDNYLTGKLRAMMNKTVFISVVLLLGLSSLVGCMHSIFYEYERSSVTTARGFFRIGFEPQLMDKEVDGKKVIVWTEPYYFNTQYRSIGNTFLKGEIKHLVI